MLRSPERANISGVLFAWLVHPDTGSDKRGRSFGGRRVADGMGCAVGQLTVQLLALPVIIAYHS